MMFLAFRMALNFYQNVLFAAQFVFVFLFLILTCPTPRYWLEVPGILFGSFLHVSDLPSVIPDVVWTINADETGPHKVHGGTVFLYEMKIFQSDRRMTWCVSLVGR
ncbi:hypothetical protein RvY_02172-2 [Ramazzottius varieornatus]|uniref:Uncharacterized protein n=1 Tax=Ramazzottius varieornatus TaxID=947166 RepID=A0A1D1UIT4_RAMVA|nr:hypothetical protein RvY_02172-2 [Ramazzottius varieornatus]